MKDLISFEVIRAENGGVIVMQRFDPGIHPVFYGAYTNGRDFVEAMAKVMDVEVVFESQKDDSPIDVTQLRMVIEAVKDRQIV